MADTEVQGGRLTAEQAKIVKEFSAIHRRQWEAMLTTMRQMGEAIGEALRQAGAGARPAADERDERLANAMLAAWTNGVDAAIHATARLRGEYDEPSGASRLLEELHERLAATAANETVDPDLVALYQRQQPSAPLATHYPGDGQGEAEVRTEWGCLYPGAAEPATSSEATVRRWVSYSQNGDPRAPLAGAVLVRRTHTVGPWLPADASTPEEHDRTGAGR